MENTNARYLTKEDFPENIDGIVTDVSFISLRLIFPVIKEILSNDGNAFVLIKPQFECGLKVAKKYHGVIKDEKIHAECIKSVVAYFAGIGFDCVAICQSPIKGGDGNIEFLSYFVKNR
jgi:23S rRNA (cytidine1920-2'-O)/16S rRNA (cytidine1409-2'-O)-methyltransferase